MTQAPLKRADSPKAPAALRRWLAKAAGLLVAGVLFGWAYAWAAPRLYRPETAAGFWLGTVHGALMPVALPSLLAGRDVPIYAAATTGRGYKLGYIAGINACGFVVFGLAFWKPARRPPPTGETAATAGRQSPASRQ